MIKRLLVVIAVAACGNSARNAPQDGSSPVDDASQGIDAAIAIDAPIDAPVAPVFRNKLTMTDAELAPQALQLLGANVANASTSSCNQCHGLTKQHLAYWRALGDASLSTCLTDLAVTTQDSAKKMVNCLRSV
ncbi:MAG TPA: hypothetical protein VGC41_20985, partial [Kofleriaceae bacterium]